VTRPEPYPVLAATTSGGHPLRLRPPDVADVDEIVLACTDPDTRAWTMIPLDFDHVRARGFVANARSWWERDEGVRWVIADGDDRCVGLFDLRVLPGDPRAAEVFFISSPRSRGKGYLSAALRAVAVWAVAERGLARVEWRALVGNDGSRRVAERAGFHFEGISRQSCDQRGTRYDAWVASLIAADLPGTTPEPS
jgi:RimJ/RimL family protein N-acetyltransferase